MSERDYLILLSTFVPFGPARVSLFLKYFGSAKKSWEASFKKLTGLGLSDKLVNGFSVHREKLDVDNYFKRLDLGKIGTVTIIDSSYPDLLKEITYPPTTLYFKGDISVAGLFGVAVVGSRKMSSYGKEVAEIFARGFSQSGIVVISGLARGIDTVAHKTALTYGKTIAVVGSGLNNLYPPENIKLVEQIIKGGSLVMSEYPLDYPAIPTNFPARNRIISALSRAILIVEGRKKSGTLLTASHALEQGKDVYVVPGQITSPLSEAPLYLLQNGARPAIDPKDIVDELGYDFKTKEKTHIKLVKTPQEQSLIDILNIEPTHIDELVRITSHDIASISARLTLMEIKGLVKNIGGGIYRKT